MIAGTISGSGSLRVEVTGTGDDTTLAGIMRLVEQAQGSRSTRPGARRPRGIMAHLRGPRRRRAHARHVARRLAPSAAYAVERMVTVLVIACPHALGLAVPLVIAISTTLGAQSGLLVRDRRGLEDARQLDTVVFDKTGTLTLGEHRVVAMQAAAGLVGRRCTAARRRCRGRRGASGGARHRRRVPTERSTRRSPSATAFEAMAGRRCAGRRRAAATSPWVGRTCCASSRWTSPAEFARFAERCGVAWAGRGVSGGGDARCAAPSRWPMRCDPRRRMRSSRLRDAGVEVVMLTGDAQAVADAVARRTRHRPPCIAEVLPEPRQRRSRRCRSRGSGWRWWATG